MFFGGIRVRDVEPLGITIPIGERLGGVTRALTLVGALPGRCVGREHLAAVGGDEPGEPST